MSASSSAAATVRRFRSCPFCEAHCGVAVEVEPASGRVLGVRGDPDDPISRGYLCPKAYGLKQLQEDPDRLRRPLLRDGKQWREIPWEEAFARVAERLRAIAAEHGANAIATYLGNPNAHDLGSILYGPVFQRALGTRWRFSATSVDQLPKMLSCALLYGSPTRFPVPDVDRTELLVILGANPLVSNGSLLTAPGLPRRLRRLRERGGRLVVVDPRRTETARQADAHLPIRPGTDALLLFAVVHVLFADDLVRLGRLGALVRGVGKLRELAQPFAPEAVARATGIAPATVRELARALATTERAVCYGRFGTCTQEFGTLTSWLVDVVNALTGHLDESGGALFPRPATDAAEGEPRRGRLPFARWRTRVRGLPEFGGELPVAALAEEIDTPGEGRVRALVTVAGNPVLSTPNAARLERALASLEFMVAIDFYRNETTRFADLILPPCPPLERPNYDLIFTRLSARNQAKWSPRVLNPSADAKAPWEIFVELAGRLRGVDARTIDDAVFEHFFGTRVGKPAREGADLDPETARRELAGRRGPERLLDLMLRTGPYGDRFGARPDGLTLERLAAAEHGLDLGPLEPSFPEALATKDGRIDLAPSLLVEDVGRLAASLARSPQGGEILLVGRRLVRRNNSWMGNLPALAKGRDGCTLRVHPLDAKRLGLRDGGRARIRSRVGEAVAPVEVSDEMRPGVVSLPHGYGHDAPDTALRVASRRPGVNANLLTDEERIDALSGNAVLCGVPVTIEAA